MYLIVDHRECVREAYRSGFEGEGIAATGMSGDEFADWIETVDEGELEAVEAFVLGDIERRGALPAVIRRRIGAPIFALLDNKDLDQTLSLLSEGVDDVIRKPVHVRELVARASAVWRRINYTSEVVDCGRLKVYFDGRDAEIDGEAFELPRRERRILEFLVRNAHRRVTKTQVFNAVYGLFEVAVDEVVVEGHISKLRKKLRRRLETDVIDARRYLGYQFVGHGDMAAGDLPAPAAIPPETVAELQVVA